MTDRFNPATHKFGMAYLSMGRFLVYPNNVLSEEGKTVCICPNDADFGYLDPALLTRAPEADLVPRQAVTGDAVIDETRRKALEAHDAIHIDRFRHQEVRASKEQIDEWLSDIKSALDIMRYLHPRPAVSEEEKRAALVELSQAEFSPRQKDVGILVSGYIVPLSEEAYETILTLLEGK